MTHSTAPEPERLPARPVRRPTFVQGLLALLAPRRFAESLAQADHEQELASNEPLRTSSPDRQLEHLNTRREAALGQLRRLRRAWLGSLLSMSSAVLVAWLFRASDIAPMLPRPVLAVGSVFCFAVATLGRLGWGGQTSSVDTSVERLDQRVFHILYWIGMCWATLAIL